LESRLSFIVDASMMPMTPLHASPKASTGLKCMMIGAKMRCGSCFVNFNVVLIASMFVAAYKLFA
jgi:hypothetical protein